VLTSAAMAWDKLKSLFVVTDSKPNTGAAPSPDDMAAIEAELARFRVPDDAPAASLPASTSPEQLAGTIDFQALYDQAGIPNTDEVEALEKFLGGLETSLPQSSKLAAAKAFLGAIGKQPQDVLTDAGRKIGVVRSVDEAKKGATEATRQEHQQAIAALEKQIEEHRAAIEAAMREHESVKQQCVVEEARLQGARVFFGYVETAAAK
jgi:hypothetical protein